MKCVGVIGVGNMQPLISLGGISCSSPKEVAG